MLIRWKSAYCADLAVSERYRLPGPSANVRQPGNLMWAEHGTDAGCDCVVQCLPDQVFINMPFAAHEIAGGLCHVLLAVFASQHAPDGHKLLEILQSV